MMLSRAEIGPEPAPPQPPPMQESHPDPAMAMAGADYETDGDTQLQVTAGALRSDAVDPNDPATWRKTPRNAPCPCGSGKKFKHCHGRSM